MNTCNYINENDNNPFVQRVMERIHMMSEHIKINGTDMIVINYQGHGIYITV